MKNCILSSLLILMPISPLYLCCVFFFVLAKHSNKAQVCKNEFYHKIIILPFFPLVAYDIKKDIKKKDIKKKRNFRTAFPNSV